MMKIYLFAIGFVLSGTAVSAQQAKGSGKSAARIFVTYAKIHSGAGPGSPVTDSLPANRQIQVSSAAIAQTDLRDAESWLAVSYLKGKVRHNGYIRSEDLAVASSTSGTAHYMLGPADTDDNGYGADKNLALIKVFENNKILATREFPFAAIRARNSPKLSVEGHKNLRNVNSVIKVSAHTTQNVPVRYEQYMLLTKNRQLILLPPLKNVEQDAPFSYREHLYFPENSGANAGKFRKKVEYIGRNSDDGSEENSVFEMHYAWDGVKLVEI